MTGGAALSEEVRSAVVPPPLCRGCRFCRPRWGSVVNPLMWPVPLVWRHLWSAATCRHPSSVRQSSKDYVTGRREKPSRFSCNGARLSDYGGQCGPTARYWQARAYPAWLWPIGAAGGGLVLLIAYIEFLRNIDELVRWGRVVL